MYKMNSSPTPGIGLQGDLNGDGLVNLFDYSTLVSNFGK